MKSDPRPYVLAETNWKNVKTEEYTVAILPWGATEAHNYHLPYGTDNILAENAAIEAAKKAWSKEAKVIVLPNIPFGVNTGQMDVDLCINMNPSTQMAVLKDLVQVLEANSIHKLVIVNGHGGNNFKQIIRELSIIYPTVFVCSLNWWQAAKASDYFHEPGDHAGELETAVVMHLTPNLVLPLDEAGDGDAKTFKIKGLKDGWVSAQRKWTEVTKDTGVGNPKMASPENGANYFRAVTDGIADFFVALHHADLDDMYE
ncbi:creatininase family protein [Arenibacter echinorum]|uniref:Creatinine amidohydrolase n=1 Tax=Arenibacter echinorum TaxID=440515 RepID=A0A327R776_9FLAO|nr:creatininase family protein [Arenibacter echinorum]RAJ11443.1 creatinine amidohydrolase [Arenibacter echinorum]